MAEYGSKSQVGGRLKRYAKVTTTMSGLAARMAGERYLGMDIDRDRHAAQLREALGSLKGLDESSADIINHSRCAACRIC